MEGWKEERKKERKEGRKVGGKEERKEGWKVGWMDRRKEGKDGRDETERGSVRKRHRI